MRNHVVVKVDAGVVCARCAAGNGCGAGLLSNTSQSKLVTATLDPDVVVSEGDRVGLELRPARVLQGAVIVYGYPLIAALVAALLANALGLNDVTAVLVVVIGLAAGFLFARGRIRGENCLRDFTPVVTTMLDPAAPEL
jgi:sigma-E factor negative regulatory protein RseC